jgi:hypothetical protein
MRNKPKLPAAKVGKDGCQLFNENRGYEGPDWITAIMWVTASCNVKEALTALQMELEGEQLQIRRKPSQKKNVRNQIVIYGLPPGFNQKGIMQELLHGLKECKKDLCDGNQFDPAQNIKHRELPLPLFNGYYKQATAPKAPTHSKGMEIPLTKTGNICKMGAGFFIWNMTRPRTGEWTTSGHSSSNRGRVSSSLDCDPRFLSFLPLANKLLIKSS